MPERLFSTYQVADILGATPGAVAQWMRKGWLPFVRMSSGLRISEKGLIQFLRSRGVDLDSIMAKTMLQEVGATAGGQTLAVTSQHEVPGQEDDSEGYAEQAHEYRALPLALEGYSDGAASAGSAGDTAIADDAAVADRDEEILDAIVEEIHEPVDQQPDPLAVKSAEGDDGLAAVDAAAADGADSDIDHADANGQADDGQKIDQSPTSQDDLPSGDGVPSQDDAAAETPVEPAGPTLHNAAVDNPVSQVAYAILADGVARGADAIHLENREDGLALRLRIGGALHDKANFKARLPQSIAPHLADHFLSLAGAPGATGGVFSGVFDMTIAGREVRFDLTSCPMAHGRKIVLRIRDAQRNLVGLSSLGLTAGQEQSVRGLLALGHGLILVAGASRHGLPQAMAAMMHELASPEKNGIAIGRSLGRIPHVNHVCLEGENGWEALGAEVIRAASDDADVIALEEIVDRSAAAAALQAAANGALVLAGVPDASAAQALRTMLDSSIGPRWPLAGSLRGVIALRRCRALCEECKIASAAANPFNIRAFEAVGCARCGQTGYFGDSTICQIVPMDAAMAGMIRQDLPATDIVSAADQMASATLRQAAMDGLRGGTLSMQELNRAF